MYERNAGEEPVPTDRSRKSELFAGLYFADFDVKVNIKGKIYINIIGRKSSVLRYMHIYQRYGVFVHKQIVRNTAAIFY